MGNDSFKIKKALNIEPNAAPNLSTDGDIGFNSGDSNLEVYAGGSVKKVVTTTQTQTLTNKTLTAPVIDAATLDGQASAPANPSAGYYKLYVDDTTSRLQLLDSAGTVSTVGSGSGGGINYCENPDAEAATTGWATYADAAGTSPVDGTGGSPTFTWTRTTSSPLRGLASFLATKDAANRQGEGVSYDFEIDAADKAKPLAIGFDYEVASGTYADGDLTVWIYDVTNAQVIQPSASSILNATGPQKKQTLNFQTNSNSISYRLIIHVTSTSASAYTVKFDNVSIGPQVTAGTSTVAARYSTDAGQSIPNGTNTVVDFGTKTFDTHGAVSGSGASWKFTAPIAGKYEVSSFLMYTSGGGWTNGEEGYLQVFKNGVFYTYLYIYNADSTHTSRVSMNGTSTVDLLAGDYINIQAYQGSGAALALLNTGNTNYVDIRRIDTALAAQDAETRVVAGWVGGSATTITSGAGATTVVYNTIVNDTHTDTYNTSTGAWTCKIPGWYQFDYQIVDGSISPAAADRSIQINLSVDGAGEYGPMSVPTLNTQARGIIVGRSFRLKLNAGQVVRVRAESSLGDTYTVLNNTGYSFLQWNMIQGPAQIAASTVIAAKRYFSSTALVYNTTTAIAWTNSEYDTHGGFQTSTVYTVPAPGKYNVVARYNGASQSASGAERFLVLAIRVNGVIKAYGSPDRAYSTTGREYVDIVQTTVPCNAGDTIDVVGFTNLVTSANTSNNGGGLAENFITIERVGGVA